MGFWNRLLGKTFKGAQPQLAGQKCLICQKTVGPDGVAVVRGRPSDTAGSLILAGEEEAALNSLNRLGVTNVNIRNSVVVCRACWAEKLEPDQIAIVDVKLEAIRSGKGLKQAPKGSAFIPLGNLTGDYYVSKLADLLESSKDREVLGWTLYASANNIHNYSKEIDSLVKKKLLPKVKALTAHSDREIATAANYVLKAYGGSLPYGTWKSLGAKSWNEFKR